MKVYPKNHLKGKEAANVSHAFYSQEHRQFTNSESISNYYESAIFKGKMVFATFISPTRHCKEYDFKDKVYLGPVISGSGFVKADYKAFQSLQQESKSNKRNKRNNKKNLVIIPKLLVL